MKRLIAIVEDEPAHARQLRGRVHARWLRGARLRQPRAGHGGLRARACRTWRSSTSRSRTSPRAASSCAGSCVRMSAELPIIFLTARDSELDAVSGLRLGADDFLTKDLSLAHLIARVNALFRRVDALRQPESAEELLRRGPLTLDAERMQAQWDGQVVLLSLTEFWIVHALARHPGHVKNRQQLMDAANVVLDDNTITSHVKRIRRKFQALDPKFDAAADRLRHGLPLGRIAARDVPAPEAAAARTCDPGAAVGRLPLRARDGVGAARGRGQLAPGRVADHRRLAAGAHRPAVPRAAPARRSGRRAAAGQRRAAGDRPGLRQARPR